MPQPNYSTAQDYDALGKVNYQGLPPSDSSTGWDNTKLGPCAADVAAIGQTRFAAIVRFTLAASTGALVLQSWQAVWKNATGTQPILAKSATGVFTATMPTVVSNESDQSFGISNNITVNLTGGTGNIEGATPGFINVSASANVITINIFNASGTAANLVGSTVTVFAY